MAPPQCSEFLFFVVVVLKGQQVIDGGLNAPTEPRWGNIGYWCGSWEEKSWSDD